MSLTRCFRGSLHANGLEEVSVKYNSCRSRVDRPTTGFCSERSRNVKMRTVRNYEPCHLQCTYLADAMEISQVAYILKNVAERAKMKSSGVLVKSRRSCPPKIVTKFHLFRFEESHEKRSLTSFVFFATPCRSRTQR